MEKLMRINPHLAIRGALLTSLILILTLLSTRSQADVGSCGGQSITVPFTDLAGNVFFCSIAEAYFSGLSNGTTATTYSPGLNVTREQMAAFVTRTMDQSLKRGSRRAAVKELWTPTSVNGLALTTVGTSPTLLKSDGADVWVANYGGSVSRVRGSDGKLLETWTGAGHAQGVLCARGLIYVTGNSSPGSLYVINPSQPPVAATTLPISLGAFAAGIAFDGARIWTANQGGSVSIVTLNPLSVSTVTTGFTTPVGIVYDGLNMWVTDEAAGKLFKLNSSGGIIQTTSVGQAPMFPAFDGTNIWVPVYASNIVQVIRASTGAVLTTLSGNGLSGPTAAAFDGERFLITNQLGNSVSLWKSADLSPLGSTATGSTTAPYGACSDGLNFWITLDSAGKLARY